MASGVLNGHQPHHGWFCSFFPSSTTTNYPPPPLPSPSMLQKLHVEPAMSPSPPLRDVVSFITASALPHKRGCIPSRPSPFQRDVGSLASLNGGSREGERRGGPIKWDALMVSHEIQPWPLLWFVFSIPLPIPLTDAFDPATRTNWDPKATTMRDDWTRDTTWWRRQEMTRHEQTTKVGGNDDKEEGEKDDNKEGGMRRYEKEGGVRRNNKEMEGWDDEETNHSGSKPTRVNQDQPQRIKTNHSESKPTTANQNQPQQIKTNHSKSKPTTANQNQPRHVRKTNNEEDKGDLQGGRGSMRWKEGEGEEEEECGPIRQQQRLQHNSDTPKMVIGQTGGWNNGAEPYSSALGFSYFTCT